MYCGITTANVIIGYGKHAYVLDQKTVELASLLNTLSFLFGVLSFALPKLAVTYMLTRILNPSFAHRVALWTMVALSTAISCICIVVLFTMCDPPKGLWEMSLVIKGEATCRDVWILIDYAIFTGGMCRVFCYIGYDRKLTANSILGLCGSYLGVVPGNCSHETSYVVAKATGFVCSSWIGCRVSSD